MVILKSIFGLVVGVVLGAFAGFIPALVVWANTRTTDAPDRVIQLCALLGAIIGVGIPITDDFKRRAQIADQKRKELELQQEEIRQRIKRLSGLLSASQNMFSTMAKLVPLAERFLNIAEKEFAEGAFAPFWDAIEEATNLLAKYQNGIKSINGNALIYTSEAKTVSTQVPRFDLPTRQLPDGRPTAMHLAATVRKAQKDFHFATICEQRKTNKILVEGFGTLASAIYAIGDQISYSLNDLSNSLHTSLYELLDATCEVQSAIDRQTYVLVEQSTTRKKFEDQVVESEKREAGMLDNIQRGRKPWP